MGKSIEYLLNHNFNIDEIKGLDDEEFIIMSWGKSGIEVVEECKKSNPLNMEFCQFVKAHCNACGGNWVGMILTGIKKLFPNVWNAIPDDMGIFAWGTVCRMCALLGINEIN